MPMQLHVVNTFYNIKYPKPKYEILSHVNVYLSHEINKVSNM